jgi:hypothetical protein
MEIITKVLLRHNLWITLVKRQKPLIIRRLSKDLKFIKLLLRGGTRVMDPTIINERTSSDPSFLFFKSKVGKLKYEWKITMQVKLVFANDREFTNKESGQLVRGFDLVFLNEATGETFKHFVGHDNLKGFDPKQLATIKGKELEISTTAKTFQGKTRIVLDKIVELVQ